MTWYNVQAGLTWLKLQLSYKQWCWLSLRVEVSLLDMLRECERCWEVKAMKKQKGSRALQHLSPSAQLLPAPLPGCLALEDVPGELHNQSKCEPFAILSNLSQQSVVAFVSCKQLAHTHRVFLRAKKLEVASPEKKNT